MKVEMTCPITGKRLGRAWATLLVDGATRKILVVVLSFRAPSAVSALMALREMVRRYGVLPEILVVDRGPDLSSDSLDDFLALYSVTKKLRPKAKPRFGSVIERLIGTLHSQFISNLRGNTKPNRKKRQVSKSHNPKTRAVWSMLDLYVYLWQWIEDVYHQTDHPELNNLTPNQAFVKAMDDFGERNKVVIPYNEKFIATTLPTIPRKFAQVDYNDGIVHQHLEYWSPKLHQGELHKKMVPVKFDPWDASYIYAYIKGTWIKCEAKLSALFKDRSQIEIQMASEELRKRRKDHGQGYFNITGPMLAKFFEGVREHEKFMLQRLRDNETRKVHRAMAENFDELKKRIRPPASAESVAEVAKENPAPATVDATPAADVAPVTRERKILGDYV